MIYTQIMDDEIYIAQMKYNRKSYTIKQYSIPSIQNSCFEILYLSNEAIHQKSKF